MFNPLHFYEAGKTRSGTALFPFINSMQTYIQVSTRTGNAVIKWGDGTETNYTPLKNNDYTTGGDGNIIHSYSSNYTGEVQVVFKGGLKDVYSIQLHWSNVGAGNSGQYKSVNIQDIETFFGQFPHLYSIEVNIYSYQNYTSFLKGDFAKVPNSVERIRIQSNETNNAANNTVINFSNFSPDSKLKWFHQGGYINPILKVLGDLSKTPISLFYIYIPTPATGSSITYTAGKVWASAFDTLSIPLPLTTAELDSLLADMANSITSKVGAGVIALGGYRSFASDAYVAYLQGLGFTVSIEINVVLSMPLSTNLLDTSTYLNHATMVGTANFAGGALNTSTGNYAYIPNKTSLDFGITSLYFGCKVKFNAITGTKGIMGKSYSSNSIGRYGFYLGVNEIRVLTQVSATSVLNSTPAAPYNDGNWYLLECICNRTTGVQSLYIDGVLINTVTFTPSNNNVALNARFHIGVYGDATGTGALATSELNGAIKDVFVRKF